MTRKTLGWYLRAIISTPNVSIGLGFSTVMLVFPASGFSSDFQTGILAIAPKETWALLTLVSGSVGLISLLRYKASQWKTANVFLCVVYSTLAVVFAGQHSFTGTSTYGLLAGLSALHAFDLWLPIGLTKENIKPDS